MIAGKPAQYAKHTFSQQNACSLKDGWHAVISSISPGKAIFGLIFAAAGATVITIFTKRRRRNA
jgi:hypothetical protein